MTRLSAGDEIGYTITYLEMTAPPAWPRPPVPAQPGLSLLRAEEPPVRWFLHLYDSVGAAHEWTDWHDAPEGELTAFVSDKAVSIHALMLQGWTAGFYMLDAREAGVCDLAYFGLAPEAQGRGLGQWLLKTAVLDAWATPDARKVTVNTCTLDGPRALPLYQKVGFAPVRQEERARILKGPWPREG